MSQTPTYTGGNQSSIPDKLPPDLRKKLDEAILNRQPASLASCHESFQLADHGVSIRALQRYARNLRDRIDLDEAAARIQPDDPDVSAFLPQFIGRRLLAILLDDEEASAATLHRLTLAYRAAYNVHMSIDDRKKKTPPPDPETEAVRAQAFADIREHQARLQREWAELHKITNTQFAVAMDTAHKPARPEISNLKSNPTNTHLVRDSHRAPTPAGITSREPTANPKPTPDAAHSEITNTKPNPSNKLPARPPRTNIESRIPLQDLLRKLEPRHPNRKNNQTNQRNTIRVEELYPDRQFDIGVITARPVSGG
ncbi:MAG: hypothetical protein AABZ08_11640 [Planctomycetota bacterium]